MFNLPNPVVRKPIPAKKEREARAQNYRLAKLSSFLDCGMPDGIPKNPNKHLSRTPQASPYSVVHFVHSELALANCTKPRQSTRKWPSS
jgi:hypothetical protein